MTSTLARFKKRPRCPVVRAFWAARDGVAAIEFAILAPVIVAMLTGLVSYGLVVFQKMELTNAAHAGIQLALVDASSTTAIQTAVVDSSSLGITPGDVVVTEFCECADGSSVTCGTACGDGSKNRYYMSVTVSLNVALLFWPDTVNLTQTATVRTQ